jgi:hypothetical protein
VASRKPRKIEESAKEGRGRAAKVKQEEEEENGIARLLFNWAHGRIAGRA